MTVKDLASLEIMDWPDDARDQIRSTLLDERAPLDERRVAATLAGDIAIIDDEIALDLLGLVKRSGVPEDLRADAAVALGPILEDGDTMGFDDPDYAAPVSEQTFDRIRESLRTMYTEASFPKLVRRRILEAAVRSPQEWQRGAIRAAAASGDRDWQLTALFGMGWVAGFEPQILSMLGSPDAELHQEAIRAAGMRELKGAAPHIVRMLTSSRSPKPELLLALDAAAGMPWDDVRDAVLELQGSDDEEIAMAATEAATMARGLAEMGGFGDDELGDESEEDEDD